MTSDFIQNRQSEGLELTRQQHFLDGSADLFDILAGQSRGREGLEKSIGATISLLKRAQTAIEKAEKKINDQHERIESLKKLTTVDDLTGLNNVHGLYQSLKRERARILRDEARNTLLIRVDLDNAASIREQNGEEAHKAAMKLIAQILGKEARGMDVAARINDEEFVLMFPNTSVEETLSRAQQLAKRLSRLSIIWDGNEVSISVSISLKSFGPADTPESLLPEKKESVM